MNSASKRTLLSIQRKAINPITNKPLFQTSDQVLEEALDLLYQHLKGKKVIWINPNLLDEGCIHTAEQQLSSFCCGGISKEFCITTGHHAGNRERWFKILAALETSLSFDD